MTSLQSKITRMALLAVCGTALTAPLAVLAQDTPPPPPAQQDGGPGGYHHDGDRRADMQQREQHQQEMLTRKLNLTPDQQAAVKQIYADSDAKLEALFADDSTSMQDKWPKRQAIMQDRTAAIRNVLTPQQQPQYDAIVAEEKARMQDHDHRGPGGDNPPPPPQQ